MLGDGLRETSAIETSSGLNRLSNSVRKMVSSLLNDFMWKSQERLVGCRLRLYFQRWDHSSYLNGFFTETGLCGMLEAPDYDAVDVASLFLSILIHEYCGFLETADITAIFIKYVDLVKFCCGGTWRRDIQRYIYISLRDKSFFQGSCRQSIWPIPGFKQAHAKMTCTQSRLW